MSPEFVADLERPLQIDARSFTPLTDGGELKRLVPRLYLEPAPVRTAVREFHDRQTHAGTSDGGADRDRLRIVVRFDPDPQALLKRCNPLNGTHIRHDAREHQALTYSK